MRFPLLICHTLSLGILGAATVHQGALSALNGPGNLDASGVITAGSLYDGGAGTSSDGVRVAGGIDFGDSYTPVNPSFTGSIGGVSNGTYKIQLLFWEPYFGVQVAGNVGSRVFNITVEVQPAVSGLDLIAEHGVGTINKGVLYSQLVTVSDGNPGRPPHGPLLMSHWDTSCLIKFYTPEPDSQLFRDFLDTGTSCVTCDITPLEFWAAVRRKESEEVLAPGEARKLQTSLESDLADGLADVRAADSPVFEAALAHWLFSDSA